MSLEFLSLNGSAARPYLPQIASLRLRVFWDFPYLYEGTLEEEETYLETYFKAQNSFIHLVIDEGKVVGATTSIWAEEEVESFKSPFVKHGMDPKSVFYFGESILLPEYRGRGIGKIFFHEREKFARSLGFIKTLAFCSVIRPKAHALRPQGHRDLDDFWTSQGFMLEPGLKAEFEWLDRGEASPTIKELQFWIKPIEGREDE
jgi:GNAT superfamily N-acetyltransferase